MSKIIISGVNFSATPSAPQTITIKYRINSDPDVPASYILVSNSTVVAVTGVITPPVEISGLLPNTAYTVAIYNNCNSNYIYKEIITNEEVTFIWIEDMYTCEQDELLTEDAVFTGFSSPIGLYYHEEKGRMYVVDADQTLGNIYYFDPETITGVGSVSYTPALTFTVYDSGFAFDDVRKRIYFAGADTGGLLSYNLDSDTIAGTVAYGTDGPFSRLLVTLQGDNIYCGYTGHLVIVNANTLIMTSDLTTSSIPSGSTQLSNSYVLTGVLGNLWATAAAGRTVANIAVYNASLTSVLTTIIIPGAAVIPGWGSSRYFGSAFHDVEKGLFYYNDIGSSKLHIINTSTYAIVKTISFNNREGKLYSDISMQIDPNTQKMYFSFKAYNTTSDSVGTMNRRLYIFDRDTLEFDYMIDNLYLANLVYQIGSSNVWGVSRGNASWEGNPAWPTDGEITKLTY